MGFWFISHPWGEHARRVGVDMGSIRCPLDGGCPKGPYRIEVVFASLGLQLE